MSCARTQAQNAVIVISPFVSVFCVSCLLSEQFREDASDYHYRCTGDECYPAKCDHILFLLSLDFLSCFFVFFVFSFSLTTVYHPFLYTTFTKIALFEKISKKFLLLPFAQQNRLPFVQLYPFYCSYTIYNKKHFFL